jgi:hypothetical protein
MCKCTDYLCVNNWGPLKGSDKLLSKIGCNEFKPFCMLSNPDKYDDNSMWYCEDELNVLDLKCKIDVGDYWGRMLFK